MFHAGRTINAYFLSLNKSANALDQWDSGFVCDFLEGNVWQPPNWEGFKITETDRLIKTDRAVVVLPARHHAGLETEINEQLQRIDNVVLFLLGDEEADFNVDAIEHPSIHIWVQNPHPGKHDKYYKLGTGYPPQLKQIVPKFKSVDKSVDMFFSGQITHQRREDMLANLIEWQAQGNTADITATQGFTKGLNHEQYYQRMCRAKIAPAPTGAVIPDSFRLYEALECMCYVLADERDPHGKIDGYWEWLFGEEPPFTLVKEWDNLVGRSYEVLKDWDNLIHQQTAWYIKHKRNFAIKVMEQLNG